MRHPDPEPSEGEGSQKQILRHKTPQDDAWGPECLPKWRVRNDRLPSHMRHLKILVLHLRLIQEMLFGPEIDHLLNDCLDGFV